MKQIVIPLVLILTSVSAYGVDAQYETTVQSLIELFKHNDRAKIADRIVYPLHRPRPIPSIGDRQEMLRRFNQVFDTNLTRRIAGSSTDDWTQVGWRGIMLDNGIIWIDTNGAITAVNYKSAAEEKIRQRLIAEDKDRLHQSLKQFVYPILQWRTPRFHIRIDDLGDGNYRYAAWSNGQDTREKPEIIISGGELQWDGSGGNHRYTFVNGEFKYICYVNVIGTSETPPGELEVYQGDKLLLNEEVIEAIVN